MFQKFAAWSSKNELVSLRQVLHQILIVYTRYCHGFAKSVQTKAEMMGPEGFESSTE